MQSLPRIVISGVFCRLCFFELRIWLFWSLMQLNFEFWGVIDVFLRNIAYFTGFILLLNIVKEIFRLRVFEIQSTLILCDFWSFAALHTLIPSIRPLDRLFRQRRQSPPILAILFLVIAFTVINFIFLVFFLLSTCRRCLKLLYTNWPRCPVLINNELFIRLSPLDEIALKLFFLFFFNAQSVNPRPNILTNGVWTAWVRAVVAELPGRPIHSI